MKFLFLTGNGLGDSVMLTPTLEMVKQLLPDVEIHVATLKRFGSTSAELFDGLGYKVHPILSDPWEMPFNQGLKRIVEEGDDLGNSLGIHNIQLCHTPHGFQDWRMHKIFRFADYCKVKLYQGCFKPKLVAFDTYFTPIDENGDIIKYIVVHVNPGNLSKRLPVHMESHVQSYCYEKMAEGYTVFEVDGHTIKGAVPLGKPNMNKVKTLVAKAEEVIAIDSVIMHIAGAFEVPLRTLWTVTPVHQAIPFWMKEEDLNVYAINETKTLSHQWKIHREHALKELKCL